MSRHSDLADAAVEYAKEGYLVIPCYPGTKMPMIKWGTGAKRLAPDTLRKFWADESRDPPDIALKLTRQTLVLDFDPKHNPKVCSLYPRLMEQTRCARTPSDGLHAWYTITSPTRPRTYKGMDVLTLGRIALVPPSEGRAWVGADDMATLTIKEAEALIASLVGEAGIEGLSTEEGLARDMLSSLEPIPYHRRNYTLTAIAGVLRAAGFRGDRLSAALAGIVQYVTEHVPEDEITFEDVVRICESIDWRTPQPFHTDTFTRYEYNTKDAPPPLTWLVRDFLPAEGVTCLFGLGKQGKSYVAMWLLRCLATCRPFLDLQTPNEPIRVLYVDWEKRGASLRRRLHAIAKADALRITVLEPNKALPDMIEPLRAQVALGDFQLVILDSLTIALMQGDVKEAFVVIPALFALNNLGTPVLALDHTKKPQFGEPYESLTAFGSVFKGNVASMNWRLRKVSGDPLGMNIVLQSAGNNFEVDPPDIHARIGFDFSDAGDLLTATLERAAVKSDESLIWSFLSYQTGPVRDLQIAQLLTIPITQVRKALAKMESIHRVRSMDDDYWIACEARIDEGDAP